MASSRKPPDELVSRVAAVLAAAGVSGRRVAVGLSGGLDSVVLLHLLLGLRVPLGFTLSAFHVNHRLSPHADAWETFCRDLCARWEVPFAARSVTVPRASGEGLEAAARRLRYGAYGELAVDCLALAHHRDDQAETVLLHLLRGSGPAGGAAMSLSRRLPSGQTLLRPLLGLSRRGLEEYARQHTLEWVEDESNLDTAFARNFLRHDILPRLEDRFPGCREALARSAGHLAEASALLDELAALDLAVARVEEGLSQTVLAGLGDARGRNLLRYWLVAQGAGVLPARWLAEGLRQLLSPRQDAQVAVPLPDGTSLRRFQGTIHRVLPSRHENERSWQGETVLPWAGGVVLSRPAVGEGVRQSALAQGARFQSRQGGERFRPVGGRPTRTLKHLLQEQCVPPWERERLPLLYCGEHLAWVPGVGPGAGFAAKEGESGVVFEWRPG